MADPGSGVCILCPIAKLSAEYVELLALPGTLAFWKLSLLVRLLGSFVVFRLNGCGCVFNRKPCVGSPWLPIGVFMDNFGNVGLDEGLSCGTSLGRAGAALSVTGRAEGEGGMPRVSRGVRLPLLLRPPGIGGRRSGTGDDMVAAEYGCGRSTCICRLSQLGCEQTLDRVPLRRR